MTKSTSVNTPVTFEAAAKVPTINGGAAAVVVFGPVFVTSIKRDSRSSKSNCPCSFSLIRNTRLPVSRHGNRLEWCSKGPTRITGNVVPLRVASATIACSPNICTNLFVAPVAPVPAKITTSFDLPPSLSPIDNFALVACATT